MSRADSRLLTCPYCGAAFDPDAEAEDEYYAGCSVVIIDWPDDWTPTSELDAPAKGLVHALIDDPISHPPTFIRHYNATSLDNHGTTWAALTADDPQPGEPVELVSL